MSAFVYVLSSLNRTIYVGVTNDLERRICEHRAGKIAGFTQKYRVNRLVYYEEFFDIREAIAREKQLKSFRREKKIELIERENPHWEDLAQSWFGD